MNRKVHVRFLGGKGVVIPLTYPTKEQIKIFQHICGTSLQKRFKFFIEPLKKDSYKQKNYGSFSHLTEKALDLSEG